MFHLVCVNRGDGKWALGQWGQPLFTKERCEELVKKYATGPQK